MTTYWSCACCCSAEESRKGMIYLLYSAGPCVLHTTNPGFFSLMVLRMELELAWCLLFRQCERNVSCSVFLVGSLQIKPESLHLSHFLYYFLSDLSCPQSPALFFLFFLSFTFAPVSPPVSLCFIVSS